MDNSIRIDKLLSNSGFTSRRKVEEFLHHHEVLVDGKAILEPGERVDPQSQTITIDGKPLESEEKIYLVFHKPKGVMTTVSDPHTRRTIYDYVHTNERVFPVGRLDQDSEGLVLLTNDGDLAYKLTHPKFEVEKTYQALVKGSIDEKKLELLRNGIELEDGKTAPAKVIVTQRLPQGKAWLEFKIHEGKKRQIRRMCAAVNLHIIRLVRTQMGPIQLGNLPVGKSRYLTEADLQAINVLEP